MHPCFLEWLVEASCFLPISSQPSWPCHVCLSCPGRNWFLTSLKLLRGLEDFLSLRGSLLERMAGPWALKGSVHRGGAVLLAAQIMLVRAQELDLLGGSGWKHNHQRSQTLALLPAQTKNWLVESLQSSPLIFVPLFAVSKSLMPFATVQLA